MGEKNERFVLKEHFLDGTPEEQERRVKEWLGLRLDQTFADITFTPEEEEKYKDIFAKVDTW